jgi:glycosyltransferase involved in cell wall biosynthesis
MKHEAGNKKMRNWKLVDKSQTSRVDSKLWVIIPAYNEVRMVGEVVRGVREEVSKWAKNFRIVVIDDGSDDKTGELARAAGAEVVRHEMNRGLGAALGTGLKVVRQAPPSYEAMAGRRVVVTFDGDGQHDPGDIRRVVEPILRGEADFVVGSRFREGGGLNFGERSTSGDASKFVKKASGMQPWELVNSGMPRDRWVVNVGGNLVTFLLFGVWTTDSQSGLRAMGEQAIEGIEIKTDRMEVSSEFFSEISRLKLRYAEVPIKPIYTKYSRRKGQEGLGNWNAVKILSRLVLRLGR